MCVSGTNLIDGFFWSRTCCGNNLHLHIHNRRQNYDLFYTPLFTKPVMFSFVQLWQRPQLKMMLLMNFSSLHMQIYTLECDFYQRDIFTIHDGPAGAAATYFEISHLCKTRRRFLSLSSCALCGKQKLKLNRLLH